jgi:hypothetical protein
MNNYSLLKAFLLISFLGISGVVSASPIACGGSSTLSFAGNASACGRNLTALQDVLASTVNVEAFFGDMDFGDSDGALLKTYESASNSQTETWTQGNNKWMQYSDIEDISHIGYYARGAIVSVSEPAPFLLMVLGLVGLVLARRQIH